MRPGNERDNALSAERYASRRRVVDAIKVERGCADCGYNAHPAALDFDHRDATTKRWVMAKNLQRTWVDLEAEMAKCDVVCANCHRVRTVVRGNAGRRRPSGRPRKPVPLTQPLEGFAGS